MVWKRFIVIVVAISVLTMVLVVGYSGKIDAPKAAANPSEMDEIVVRITSKGATVTDPSGNDIRPEKIAGLDKLPRSDDPTFKAELTRTIANHLQKKDVTVLWYSMPVVEFSFEASPECSCRCDGGDCRCRPDGCAR
jgi:hypothetical protein